ncbi:hypothetical protein DV735_g3618, partial [Chaetothyriales sp. CBS 134920]
MTPGMPLGSYGLDSTAFNTSEDLWSDMHLFDAQSTDAQLFDAQLSGGHLFDVDLFDGHLVDGLPDNSGLNTSLNTSFNPFVDTIEAIRSGTFVSGYGPSPVTGLAGGVPNTAARTPEHQPMSVSSTTYTQTRLFPRLAAAASHSSGHQQAQLQLQQQYHHWVDRPSVNSLQTTPPSAPTPLRDMSSSPAKMPDTPTPAPRATPQRIRMNRKPAVETKDQYSEDEEDPSSGESPPEDSADEDYKPGRQNRAKRMTTKKADAARTARRSSRRSGP